MKNSFIKIRRLVFLTTLLIGLTGCNNPKKFFKNCMQQGTGYCQCWTECANSFNCTDCRNACQTYCGSTTQCYDDCWRYAPASCGGNNCAQNSAK